MRWYLETTDGEKRFWDARFDDATVTVTTGFIDGETEVETFEFDDFDAAIAGIREQVGPLFAEGFDQRVPPEERYAPHPRIARFWSEELLEEWKAMGVTEGEPTNYRDLVAEYLATELPPELDQFLQWRSTHNFGYCNYGEWRIWDVDRWAPTPENGNLFEQLVLMDQENYLGTAMMEHLAGWVFLGTAGNGDSYFAHPNHADPNQAEVIFFNHETASPDFTLSDSIASLAWANHCYEQLESEDFDHDQFIEDFELLENRVTLPWHYGSLEEEAELEPEYEAKSRGVFYFYRATWIDYLLKQNGVVEVEDIGDLFYTDIHAGLKFEDALGSHYLTSTPLTALYWLWRLFWFDKPELNTCLDTVAEHPSPIVRDCVALIREFQDGRKSLGKIEDIFALRQRFLDLDIDPDRAEARAQEEAEAERQAELELAANLEQAHSLIANSDLDEIKEALWDFEHPDVLDVLYEHIAHTSPDDAIWVQRWNFLANQGSSRDGRSYSFENDEVHEVIAHSGALLAPRLGRAGNWRGLPLAASTAGERVLPQLLEALQTQDKYGWGIRAGANGLRALGAAEHAPLLAELAGSLVWEDGDFHGEIERGDALKATVDALGVLGGDAARDTLVGLLQNGPAKVQPRILIALGRLGDDSCVAEVCNWLQSAHSRPALFALSHIGSPAALDAIEQHIGAMVGGIADLAYELGMRQHALPNDDVDWDLAESLTRVIESKKYEDAELHETLAAMLSRHPESETAERLLREYVQHEYAAVRSAAISGLQSLGVDLDLAWYDRPTVDAIWERDGVDGLREAISNPDGVFRHNVLRKAVDEGVADQLADGALALADVYCRFTAYTNGYIQDKHDRTHYLIEALAHVGTEDVDRRLCRMWKGSNAMYAQADTLKYDRDDIQARLQPYVAEVEAELAADAPPEPETLEAEPFTSVAWLFGAGINGMSWAPNGAQLAVAGQGGVKFFDRDGVCTTDVAACRGGWVYDADYSPNGAVVAAGAHAGHLWLIDASTGEQVAKLQGHGGVPDGVRKVRFSPSGDQLATVSDDESLRIWDVAQCLCTAVWNDPADVNTVDWIDEETLVIGTDRMIRLMKSDGTEIANKSCAGIAEVRVHHERQRIYVGNAHDQIRVFTLDLEPKEDEHLPCGAVARIRFVDGGLIAASWEGENAGVSFVPFDGEPVHWPGYHAATFGLDLDPQTGQVFAGGSGGTINRWTTAGELAESDAVFHTDELASIRFCGDEVVTSSDDRSVIRWTKDGAAIARYTAETRLCDAVVAGEHVFVTGSDYSACLTLDGEEVWTATPARSEHLCLTDNALIVASYNQLLWLDRATGEVLHETESFADSFIFRWAELDGNRLAVAGYDDECFYIWDTEKRELIETWTLPASEKGGVCHIGLSGNRLFVARWDKSIVVLDTTSGAVLKRAMLSGTRYPIAASEGRLYATAGGNVEVYDSDTFEHVATVEVGTGLEEISVSPQQTVFFGAESGEIFSLQE